MGAYLVEEDVLPVATFRRKVCQITILVDAVLYAELLPELRSDLIAALSGLERLARVSEHLGSIAQDD